MKVRTKKEISNKLLFNNLFYSEFDKRVSFFSSFILFRSVNKREANKYLNVINFIFQFIKFIFNFIFLNKKFIILILFKHIK